MQPKEFKKIKDAIEEKGSLATHNVLMRSAKTAVSQYENMETFRILIVAGRIFCENE